MSTSSPPSRRFSLPLRARLATTVGGAAGRASRLAGRGDGSVIGGVIGLRVDPDLLAQLAAGRQIVLVTGTNGKTTTTRLITAALGVLGQQVASNAFGANMETGLVAALAKAPDAPYAVLEVDEHYLPAGARRRPPPRVVALLNLSRDQIDRAAEIGMMAQRWRAALAAAPGRAGWSPTPTTRWWRGRAGHARRSPGWPPGQRWHDDSWCCPECGSPPARATASGWCSGCPTCAGPRSDWVARGRRVIDPAGAGHGCSTCPARPGQPVQRGDRAGRGRRVRRTTQAMPSRLRAGHGRSPAGTRRSSGDGRSIRLLLAKNPAGWLEAFDDWPTPAPMLLAINARDPDGMDTSWLYDVDFRPLRGRQVLVTGDRARPRGPAGGQRGAVPAWSDGVDEAVAAVPPRASWRSSPTTRRSRTSERSWTVSTEGAHGERGRLPARAAVTGRASAVRLVWIYPDLLQHLRRPGQPADPRPPGQAARPPGRDRSRCDSDQPVPADGDIYLLGGGEDGPQALAARRLAATAGCTGPSPAARWSSRSAPATRCSGPSSAAKASRCAGLGLLDIRCDRGEPRASASSSRTSTRRSAPRAHRFREPPGVTRRGRGATPLATVVTGVGNGDGTEGAYAGRVVGTYLHGPVLVRNPGLADMLLGWVTGTLPPVDPRQEDLVRKLRAERLAAQGAPA